jgi:hypothetical protein
MRYARLRGGESPPPIISDFRDLLDCSFRIATFGLLTSGSPTCWHLEIVVKPRNASFATTTPYENFLEFLCHTSQYRWHVLQPFAPYAHSLLYKTSYCV